MRMECPGYVSGFLVPTHTGEPTRVATRSTDQRGLVDFGLPQLPTRSPPALGRECPPGSSPSGFAPRSSRRWTIEPSARADDLDRCGCVRRGAADGRCGRGDTRILGQIQPYRAAPRSVHTAACGIFTAGHCLPQSLHDCARGFVHAATATHVATSWATFFDHCTRLDSTSSH